MKLHIIAGTTRPNRHSLEVAEWVANIAKQRPDLEVKVVDLKEVNLPLYDEPNTAMMRQYTQEHTKKWSKIVDEADAFIFVTAEYDHSVPAVLKNAIDYLFHEWNHKAVGFVSYGSAGGARAVEHLRSIVAEVKMADVRPQVLFFLGTDFENYTIFKPQEKHAELLNTLLDDLTLWGNALKTVRQK